MILSNELRIGNRVNVFEIMMTKRISTINNAIVSSISEGHIKVKDSKEIYSYDNVEGVLLTPEILEKCGFKSYGASDTSYFIVAKEINFFVINIFDGEFYLAPQVDFKESQAIKYLHQLQNLYFALTGEELKVNL